MNAYKGLSGGRYCKKLPSVSNVNALGDISLDDSKSCVHFNLSRILFDVWLNGTFPVAYFIKTLCYCYCLFNLECPMSDYLADKRETPRVLKGYGCCLLRM